MKDNKRLEKMLLIIMSVQTILMGITFIIQVLRVYYGNNKTYSREICSEYLLEILPVLIAWIILIVINFIYFTLKNQKNKNFSKISNMTKMHNLENIVPEVKEDNEIIIILKKEQKKRTIFRIITIITISLCSLMGLLYLINPDHYSRNNDLLVKEAISMAVYLLPWVVISFVMIIANTLFDEISAKKTINLLKELIKTNGKNIKPYKFNKRKQLILNIIRGSILTCSIVLIVVGITQGGANDVLQKAIKICTECIGLG